MNEILTVIPNNVFIILIHFDNVSHLFDYFVCNTGLLCVLHAESGATLVPVDHT